MELQDNVHNSKIMCYHNMSSCTWNENVIEIILSYLSYSSRMRTSRVCKMWANVTKKPVRIVNGNPIKSLFSEIVKCIQNGDSSALSDAIIACITQPKLYDMLEEEYKEFCTEAKGYRYLYPTAAGFIAHIAGVRGNMEIIRTLVCYCIIDEFQTVTFCIKRGHHDCSRFLINTISNRQYYEGTSRPLPKLLDNAISAGSFIATNTIVLKQNRLLPFCNNNDCCGKVVIEPWELDYEDPETGIKSTEHETDADKHFKCLDHVLYMGFKGSLIIQGMKDSATRNGHTKCLALLNNFDPSFFVHGQRYRQQRS